MTTSNKTLTPAAELNASLDHPIIDADGHWLEFGSYASEMMRKIGGDKAQQGFEYYTTNIVKNQLALSDEERRHQGISHPVWWGLPTSNTRDRATVMMPELLYQRLGDFGVDFAVLYPTAGLGLTRIPDPEVRRATCRAFNVMSMEMFGRYSDKVTPVAVIPMHDPAEAVAELEHAAGDLKMKAIMMGSLIPREIPACKDAPEQYKRFLVWHDTLGLDSAHNYDEVWSSCRDLKVNPTFHTGSRGMGNRTSPSNFVYNHIGHFAAASEAVAKALVLGGVTERFPELKFAFQEGGVAWACSLFADMVEHYETRSAEELEILDPDNLDVDLLCQLADEYAPEMAAAMRDENAIFDNATLPERVAPRDDFAAAKVDKLSDLAERFAKPFYFGCEADDRTVAWAYAANNNPFGSKLNTLFGSDIGHFDVSDMSSCTVEAHKLVKKGVITADDFKAQMFENPARFWGQSNPDFFKGTAVETQVAQYLKGLSA
jgi:predicted TIM-barrel fold metal-dependent hydrolase